MTKKKEDFDYKAYHWRKDVDYRAEPERYRVGKGEQGVLLCEPYKGEILPHWRFKTPELAQISADSISELFLAYLDKNDFVGADMARKFLQMGHTRARRYTNYVGGRKYDKETKEQLARGEPDPDKAQSAIIFKTAWRAAEDNPTYKKQKAEWKKKHG